MLTHIKAALMAAIVLFIWSAISWMSLPWHYATLNHFSEESAVSNSIVKSADHSGMYILPSDMAKPEANKLFVFASVGIDKARNSMTTPLIISFLTQFFAAFLVSILIGQLRGTTYFKRVVFTVIFALAAATVTEIPYWNWFCFDPKFVLVNIADLFIGWLLAGLILAKFSVK